MSKTEKVELKRFTTLIQPNLLSQIKLISYFTNKKLNECINESVLNYINDLVNPAVLNWNFFYTYDKV